MTAVNIFFFIRTIIFLNAKNKQDKKNGYKLMKTRNLLINYPLIGTSWIVLSLISFIIQPKKFTSHKDKSKHLNNNNNIIETNDNLIDDINTREYI